MALKNPDRINIVPRTNLDIQSAIFMLQALKIISHAIGMKNSGWQNFSMSALAWCRIATKVMLFVKSFVVAFVAFVSFQVVVFMRFFSHSFDSSAPESGLGDSLWYVVICIAY